MQVNGGAWSSYTLTDKELTLTGLPAGDLVLEVATEIKPQENSLLEGLYKSGGNFCTQVAARMGGHAGQGSRALQGAQGGVRAALSLGGGGGEGRSQACTRWEAGESAAAQLLGGSWVAVLAET